MSAPQQPKKNTLINKDKNLIISDPLDRQFNPQDAAMQNQALRLMQTMQTTLDVYDLIRHFCKGLRAIVPIHSFHFSNPPSQHEYHEGAAKAHCATYQLSIEDEKLGELTVTRDEPFTEDELEQLEVLISQVMYPLKNALQYHQAIVRSLTCSLTGLGNRHAYDLAIKREYEFCTRHNLDLSLLVCDLDKFKKINDTYGHAAGDYVITETGHILAKICRDSDIVFRIGGEEFVIILKNTNLHGAKILADRIRYELSHQTLNWEDHAFQITISVGISALKSHDTTSTLFKRADEALYQAKRKGGDHTVVS